MLTAKQLMKRDDWKHLTLWKWANDYEETMTKWANIFPNPVADDRRVFINTYCQVYEAIDFLPDEPPAWICVAIRKQMDEESKIMDAIMQRFSE